MENVDLDGVAGTLGRRTRVDLDGATGALGRRKTLI